MKRYFRALAVLYSLLLVSAVIQSCCSREIYITEFGDVRVFDSAGKVQFSRTGRDRVIEVNGPFQLHITFGIRYAALRNVSLIPVAMATRCKETYHNSIEESGHTISLDRSFVFNGDTVVPGTNILELPASGITLLRFERNSVDYSFSEGFLKNAEFFDDNFLVKFSAKTNDGLFLNAETRMAILE